MGGDSAEMQMEQALESAAGDEDGLAAATATSAATTTVAKVAEPMMTT